MTRRCAVCVAAVVVSAWGAAAEADYQVIVMGGDPAVGTPGTYRSGSFQNPLLNDNGQIVFTTEVQGTARDGIWRYTPGTGVEVVAVRFTPAGGVGAGVQFDTVFQPTLNAAGNSTWDGIVFGPGVTSSNERLLSYGAPGSQATIIRQGNAPPGGGLGVHDFIFLSGIGPSGHVSGWSALSGPGITGGVNDEVLTFGTPGSMETIARLGSAAPGGIGTFRQISSQPSINASGRFAYSGNLSVSFPGDSVVFTGTSAASQQLVARQGDAAPGGGNFTVIAAPIINSSNTIVFAAGLDNVGNSSGIYYGTVGSLNKLGRTGDTAPGTGGGTFFNFDLNVERLNNNGLIPFRGTLNVGVGGTTTANDSGIWMGNNSGNIVLVAREGSQAPGTPAGVVFQDMNTGGHLAVNDAGHVAWYGPIAGPGVNATNDEGVWISDGIQGVLVARDGDSLGGKTINFADFSGGSSGDGSNNGLNVHGQLALRVGFTDSTEDIYLWTPDLHWRGTAANNIWDTALNWTLSIAPAHRYDVFLDPAVNTVVTGPFGFEVVDTLTIGGGAGDATLRTQPGSAIAVNSFNTTILSNGTLAGNGEIHSNIVSAGTISPGASAGRLDVNGDVTLQPTSELDIELGGYAPGINSDYIFVIGVVNLDGAVDVSTIGLFQIQDGDEFTIMTSIGYNGAFDTGPNGEVDTVQGFFLIPSIVDTGGFLDLRLTAQAVPEPGTLALAGGALWLALRRRRA